MPSLEYFVVAESATVDQLSNRVSVFNIYDEILIPKFPMPIGPFVSVCSWNASKEDKDEEFQVSVKLQMPDGDHGPFNSNFTMKAKRHRTILTMNSIPISRAGTIVFEILLNGEHKAFHTIDVRSLES